MEIKGLFIFFHVGSNAGYAIGRLEDVFLEMGIKLTGDINRVHFGYTSLDGGRPTFLPENFKNVIEFNSADPNKNGHDLIYDYIKQNNIEIAFGFDQPISRPAYPVMRKAGIKLFISYMGSPVSSLNQGIKLLIKRAEVTLRRFKPDHFIFESKAAADSAVFGRGISPGHVSVVSLGVDAEKFKPISDCSLYAHQVFNIPAERKIVYYSGHMEERKGVHVIVEAANELILKRKRQDIHFLILGNKDGQEKIFDSRYLGTDTEKYITFGGYRNDIVQILSSSYVGVIASTGWDSFTVSALEIASSGLPLIVSNLQGLVETIEENKTGFFIEPGDHLGLADKIELFLNDPELKKSMGVLARDRIVGNFSRGRQIDRLAETVQSLYCRC